MELTDPHLPVLSQFWLAALKDMAYLFLPVEFGSQLPPTGGTFYSVDVMDSVRPYYQSNWSSLLHAAAIWLQERGFGEMERESVVKVKPPGLPEPLLSVRGASRTSFAPPPSDARVDSFHLVLGLATQCLCTSEALDQPHLTWDCLRALGRLLASRPVALQVLGSDARFSVEILSVLHRLLLTSQSSRAHVMVLRIALLVAGILQDAITADADSSGGGGGRKVGSIKEEGGGAPRHTPKEEGGVDNAHPKEGTGEVPANLKREGVNDDDEGEGEGVWSSELSVKVPVRLERCLRPGRSCTYSLLEVVSCCLLRLVPTLRPSSSSSSANKPHPLPHASSSSSLGSTTPLPKKEELVAMSLSLKILAASCGLCSPEATPSLLPPVLHMFLCTLGHMSTFPADALLPGLPSSALQALRHFCSSLPLSHDLVGAGLVRVLQSAMVSVLGGPSRVGVGGGGAGEKEEAEELVMSEETRLMVTAVLIHVQQPSSLPICPAPSPLFDACAALLERCLHSSEAKVIKWV